MGKVGMKVNIRRLENDPNMFEFTFSTPILRSQFLLPREMVNQLRILIEKALVSKTSL